MDGSGDAEDVVGPIVSSSPLFETPAPPAVSAVASPNGELPCAGGQLMLLSGSQFGDGLTDRFVVRLANSRGDAFEVTGCTVAASSAAECLSPVGVGSSLSFVVIVNGIESDVFHSGLSFGAPTVFAFSGAGADGAPTAGGDVVIRGKNFGPTSLQAVDAVVYTDPGLGTRYAASCVVTADDVELTCRTPGGVGSRLLWTVIVRGLSSSNPSTGYHQPAVDAVLVSASVASWQAASSDNAALSALATRGLQGLVFRGRYFGPSRLGVPITATGVGFGGDGSRAVVAASDCQVVVDETVIACVTPSGGGVQFSWTIQVAHQASDASAVLTSYAPPRLLNVSVSDSLVS